MPLPRRLIPLLLSLCVVFLYWHYSSTSSQPPTMASTKPLRVAILEADTPQHDTNAKYGGYGGVFTSLLTSACKSFEPPQDITQQLAITSHDVVNDLESYPNLDDVDALLITGSKHNAFDDEAWIIKLVEFAKKALDGGRVRVVGVCFGHQIVGRAVGMKVGKSDKGWEIAVSEVDLTPKGKEVFKLDTMRIHQMHRDIVFSFPPDATPLGGNGFCDVQAMYLPNRYITVQGHPEFTENIITEVITNRHKSGVFDDKMYEGAMERARKEHDGVAIARAFLKFMREG